METLEAFFVYGTLKRGQVRESCWPHRPRDVRSAWTRGGLYDLGSYPAMVLGDDQIAGEIYWIASEDLDVTLKVLDEIEDYRQPGHEDLYVRRVLPCVTSFGENVDAWAYLFANPADLPASGRVLPGDDGFCVWP